MTHMCGRSPAFPAPRKSDSYDPHKATGTSGAFGISRHNRNNRQSPHMRHDRAVPNFAWMEVWVSPTGEQRHTDPDIFPQQHKLEGTRFPVPDTPGLGVECNEDYLKKEAFKFWEAPHLHRLDGSYTNW